MALSSLRTMCLLMAIFLVSSCSALPSELCQTEPGKTQPQAPGDHFGTLTRAVYGNPLDVAAANDDRHRRANIHLYAALKVFHESFNDTLPPWAAGFGVDAQTNARRAVTLIAAILTILSNPERFQDANGSYTDYTDVEDFITSQGSEVDTFLYYRSYFAQYLSAIYPLDKVGTGGDYDFVLGPLINLLYSLKDTTHYTSGDLALTNDMIFDILCQNSDACLQDNQPFHSFRVGNWDLIANPQPLAYHPETENHVLMILTWNFLATTWVMWQGHFPSFSDARYSTDMISMRQDNFVKWMEIRDSMQDLLLKVLGRIVHRGLFETNARPYQHYALLPIFLLANHSTVPVDPDVPEYTSKVMQAAQNAFHYIATKLTFQSLKQKRIAPMRRSYERTLLHHHDQAAKGGRKVATQSCVLGVPAGVRGDRAALDVPLQRQPALHP